MLINTPTANTPERNVRRTVPSASMIAGVLETCANALLHASPRGILPQDGNLGNRPLFNWLYRCKEEMDMSVEGKVKEGAGYIKEEMNEHKKDPESQRKAQEGRDLRNEGRMEDGKAPKTTKPGTGGK